VKGRSVKKGRVGRTTNFSEEASASKNDCRQRTTDTMNDKHDGTRETSHERDDNREGDERYDRR
jgi:hypothetical protein